MGSIVLSKSGIKFFLSYNLVQAEESINVGVSNVGLKIIKDINLAANLGGLII